MKIMAKKADKTSFVCNDCGETYARWVGKCTAIGCGQWNTVVEFKEAPTSGSHGATPIANNKKGYSSEDGEVEILDNVVEKEFSRHLTGSSELDRVLGGGVTEGSVVLISGDPGAGKSTLLIAVMAHLSKIGSVLVNSGEENKIQIKNRSKRLGLDTSRVHIMTNGDVERMCQECVDNNHRFLLVDSIQVMFMNNITSAPGSVTQVKECAAYINRTAKKHGLTVFLVVHSTKKEGMAGPQTLAHIGDTTLLIECENDSKYRTLRAKKNRFGSADEIGTFAMTSEGMQDISNPSAIFLEHGGVQSSGNVVFASSEGRRTLLLNLQSLVTAKAGEYPQRVFNR
jgi:DNA repair protein RadA/Sms